MEPVQLLVVLSLLQDLKPEITIVTIHVLPLNFSTGIRRVRPPVQIQFRPSLMVANNSIYIPAQQANFFIGMELVLRYVILH